MANTINFLLAQMTAQPSNAEALYNFLQALLDSLSLHVVVSSTTAAQPGSPTEEQAYILPVSATGTAWATNDKKVAVYINGSWYFFAPKDGWLFFDQLNQKYVRYDLATTTWIDVSTVVAETKSLSILNPSNAENLTMAYFKRASTIKRVNAVLRGSGGQSKTIQLVQGTDRSAAGTNVFSSGQAITSITTGQEFTSFNDATMPAGSFLWLTTSAGAGTVNELHVTVEYTEDG